MYTSDSLFFWDTAAGFQRQGFISWKVLTLAEWEGSERRRDWWGTLVCPGSDMVMVNLEVHYVADYSAQQRLVAGSRLERQRGSSHVTGRFSISPTQQQVNFGSVVEPTVLVLRK